MKLSTLKSWLVNQVFGNLFRPKFLSNGTTFYPATATNWGDVDHIAAYEEVPEVNAVINKDAELFSNGKLIEVDRNGKPVGNSELTQLFENPNWMQSEKELLMQTRIFRNVLGNEYIYFLFPVGFSANRTKAIFTIPGNIVRCEYLDTVPFFLHSEKPNTVRYQVSVGGGYIDIDPDQIVHLNDNRVTIQSGTDKTLLLGTSKLKALAVPVQNIRYAYESRGVFLKQRGALGILTNVATDKHGLAPFDEEDIEKVQQKYRSKYGGLADQFNLIISSNALKWQSMAIDPEKLGVYKEVEESFYRIVDSFGMRMDLFSLSKGSTYENQKQAERSTYESHTIPVAAEWAAAINRKFDLPRGRRIVLDYMHLPIFQENLKERADTVAQMVNALTVMYADGAMTIDDYKLELSKLNIQANGKGKQQAIDPTGENSEE